ncbi:atpD [Symbiodinium pilosum]|uniref:AtpD protein n=1 Tax=Symbiodinium pilosum TaxID=2952 RepID=A0A812W6I6_SYMPI|nr:atpD [Symbiodinium pilosum]
MRAFPDDKQLMIDCITAMSGVILFNRDNGLRAGALGGLNYSWGFYSTHMDDPDVTALGGAIGCFMDYVDENRAIGRELGVPEGLVQNMRNNFHGKYSDWAYEPVKHSLYALSSTTWRNQDIVMKEGFVPLDIAILLEHGHESKIAEESLQVVKALTAYSDDYRHVMANEGLFKALAHVLDTRYFDRGAVSLIAESTIYLIGPAWEGSPEGIAREIAYNAKIQEQATEQGFVDALLRVAMSPVEMKHFEHGAFNFNIDQAYPAQMNTYVALNTLAKGSPVNQATMVQAGIVANIAAKFPTLEDNAKPEACKLVATLHQQLNTCP